MSRLRSGSSASAAKGASADEFYVITGRLRLFSTFGAVSSIALADQEGAAA